MSQPSGKMICSDRTPGERGSFARCLAALLLVVVGLAVQSRAAGQSVPDDGSVGPRILFSSPFAPEPAPFLHSRVSVSDPLPGTVVRTASVVSAGAIQQVSWDEYLQFSGSGGGARASQQSSVVTAGNMTLLAARSAQEGKGKTDPAAGAVSSVGPGGKPDEPAVAASPTVTVESIAAQKAAAEKVADLAEDVRNRLAKHFQRATEQVQQKADADRRLAELRAEREGVPAQLTLIREQLAQNPVTADPGVDPMVAVAELDKLRQADDERAAEARRNLEAWETRARVRTERKPQMPALIEMTRQQLEEAKAALAAGAPEGELPLLTQARRLEQQTLVELLQSQLELLRAEQAGYDALSELYPLQRDVLIRVRNTAEKRMEAWQTVLAEARRLESARQTQEAREKLRNAHPTLKTLAEDNSKLTLRRKEIQEFLETKTAALQLTSAALKSLEERFRRVQAKELRAGLTTAMGLLLRSEKNQIPDAAAYRRRFGDVEADIVRLQAEQMQLEDQRAMLGDMENQVDLKLAQIGAGASQQTPLREMTQELLLDQRQYLDNLLADYDVCLQTLGELDISERSLDSTATSFREYIDERVLWIRSSQPLNGLIFRETWQAIQQFWASEDWPRLVLFLMEDLSSSWLQYLAGLVLFLAIAGSQSRIRAFSAGLAAERQKQGRALLPTMLATMGLTLLTSAAWPLVPGFAAYRLGQADAPLAGALQQGFLYWGSALLVLDFFRRLCRRNGVAEDCLEWPSAVCQSLHAGLQTYILLGLPLGFCVVVADELGDGISAESLGRLAFLIRCLLLLLLLRPLLDPNGSVLRDLLRASPDSWVFRLRWVWYSVAVAAPVMLAILASVGYQYTARELMLRLQMTLVMAAAFAIAWTILMKWLLEARRNLAIRQARARRAAAVAAQKDAEQQGAPTSPIPPVEIPRVDISLLNQQMLRLLRATVGLLFLTAVWLIWGQVLPALQVLSRVELWPVVISAMERIPGADVETFREVTRVEQVTLGNLLTALLVVFMAVLASRNMPALLELSVLQRLPLDHGNRHALTTVSRYVLLLTGGLVSCSLVGIGWQNVQWLAAALTVGLGFGLQEIFANFVSGLIILFERPVRIGDIVTIDGVTGAVSRIQIRATTITDWDRKEFIVPNKEFVTGKLLNWTLSDRVNRVLINVGVAYGTRTESALALLQQIADTNPLVLKDPAPIASFEGFGDSTLNLVLRCYLPTLDHRLKAITELHAAIHDRFAAEGLAIAFPQRDLHLRTLPPGVVLNTVPLAGPAEDSTAAAD
ncbi:MAG: mechanosensitive ion channel domain-containing protein [Planctomyces sp.]